MRNLACGALQKFNSFQKYLPIQGFRSFQITSQSVYSENKDCAEVPSKTNDNSSQEDDEKRSQEDDEKRVSDTILKAALPFVLKYGWTKNAITAGAEATGYPGVAHALFPRGGAHLIHHFYAGCNQKLAEHLELMTADLNRRTSTPVFVTYAVEYRLRLVIPYIEKWPQALGIMALPPNVPTSLANLLTLIDDVCYYAGDRSVDFRWYTRRVTLAGIYKLTELFMVQDKSDDFRETWLFLHRRIDDAANLHSFVKQSEEVSVFARDTAAAAFVTARNIFGLNKGFR